MPKGAVADCLQHSVPTVRDISRRKWSGEGRNKAASRERVISQALLIVRRGQESKHGQTKCEEAVMPTFTKGSNPERTPGGHPKHDTCSHAGKS